MVTKDSQFIQRLETFIRMTISHIFTKYKDSPLETKNANIALSQFIQVGNIYVWEKSESDTVTVSVTLWRKPTNASILLLPTHIISS